MNILVLNGSPAGKNSITLQTVLYLEQLCEKSRFQYLHVGQQIKRFEKDFAECEEALRQADLILFCYPVYTFLAPAQLHRFLELIKEKGVDLRGKYASQISTSKHFYDTTAHEFIRENCEDLGLRYVRGLSADMEDLLQESGQKQARDFLRFVFWSMKYECAEPVRDPARRETDYLPVPVPDLETSVEKKGGCIAVVTDLAGDADGQLRAMIRRFDRSVSREIRLIDLSEVRIDGGCLGCFHCASSGACVYRDGFDAFLREQIQTTDAIVYAFRIKDHSMGSRFKLYDDRQFCNGHRTVTMGKPVGYLVSGPLDREPNLLTLIEGRSEVGGNFLAGVATDQRDPAEEIRILAQRLEYAVENKYQPPKNFYGVGGLKIFRDLIYQMQGMMKEDHRFYKRHGFYDFPQKRRGRILGMYLVGAAMSSPKLQKKMNGKMTEGMLMPYQRVLKKAKKN